MGSQPVLLQSRWLWVSELPLISTRASSRFGFPRCQGTAPLGTWRPPCSFLETKALGGVRGLAAGGPESPWMPAGGFWRALFPLSLGSRGRLALHRHGCLHIHFTANGAAAVPIGSRLRKRLTRATAAFPLLYRAYLVCAYCCNDGKISSDARRIFLNSLCNFFQRDALH